MLSKTPVISVAVDPDGNPIVAGYSTDSWVTSDSNLDGGWHGVVVKLEGQTGDELWRYQTTFADSTSDDTYSPSASAHTLAN